MADTTLQTIVTDPNGNPTVVNQRVKDMGDGTFAKVLATSASGSGTTADQVQGNVASGATDAGNPVKAGGVYNSPPPTLTSGQRGDVQLDVSGNVRTRLVATASTGSDGFSNSVGYVMASTSQTATSNLLAVAPYSFNGATFDRQTKANSTSRIVSAAASTNATSAKASAGNVHSIEAYNTTASVKYLKLYNKASAPTVGTDTPVRTIALAPNARSAMTFPNGGLYFSTGIAYGLTGAAADSDTTALTAGDVVGVNIDYS
jgi:hypothetical protein